MSIEIGLSMACTPAECYVHKRARKDFYHLTVGMADYHE